MTVTLGVGMLLSGPPVAEAQLPSEAGRCYRFDRHYFQWMSVEVLAAPASVNAASVLGDSLVFDAVSASGTLYKVLEDSSLLPWRRVYRDSSAVVRLAPDLSDWHRRLTPSAHMLVTPAMPEVASTQRLREMSYWRLTETGTVELAWLNGYGGVTFQLERRPDSLHGRVTFRTDVVGREPEAADAWAVRIACEE